MKNQASESCIEELSFHERVFEKDILSNIEIFFQQFLIVAPIVLNTV